MSISFKKISFRDALKAALILFFLAGATGNIFPPSDVTTDYQRWGYPHWFHYLTGALELAIAGLLVRRDTQLAGLLLGAIVMMSALLTLTIHGELTHAMAPGAILIALAACFHLDRREQAALWAGDSY